MTTPASISPPRPAGSLKRRAARKNSCRPTPQILIPLSTAGFPSNNASVNTCLSTTAICTRRWTPYLPNNQHLSGKDYMTQDNAEFRNDLSPLSRPVQLPQSITFADIQTSRVGRISTGRLATHFQPQGYAD